MHEHPDGGPNDKHQTKSVVQVRPVTVQFTRLHSLPRPDVGHRVPDLTIQPNDDATARIQTSHLPHIFQTSQSTRQIAVFRSFRSENVQTSSSCFLHLLSLSLHTPRFLFRASHLKRRTPAHISFLYSCAPFSSELIGLRRTQPFASHHVILVEF